MRGALAIPLVRATALAEIETFPESAEDAASAACEEQRPGATGGRGARLQKVVGAVYLLRYHKADQRV